MARLWRSTLRAWISFAVPASSLEGAGQQRCAGVKRIIYLDTELAFTIPGAAGVHNLAWNEFQEGGIVAPTQSQGFMRLQAIKEVFEHGSLVLLFIPQGIDGVCTVQGVARRPGESAALRGTYNNT